MRTLLAVGFYLGVPSRPPSSATISTRASVPLSDQYGGGRLRPHSRECWGPRREACCAQKADAPDAPIDRAQTTWMIVVCLHAKIACGYTAVSCSHLLTSPVAPPGTLLGRRALLGRAARAVPALRDRPDGDSDGLQASAPTPPLPQLEAGIDQYGADDGLQGASPLCHALLNHRPRGGQLS